MKIEILLCDHCCKRALCVGGERFTTHKCAGQWTIEEIVEVDSRGMVALAEAMRDEHEKPRRSDG